MLDRTDILSALSALDEELQRQGLQGEIVLVGGAALVLSHEARLGTKDVDAILLVPAQALKAAASVVAASLGLPDDWLNDRAWVFAAGVAPGPVVYSSATLLVRSASSAQLLAMKLSAMRDSVDYNDAELLLSSMTGTRDEIWAELEPFLDPSQPEWKRRNFGRSLEGTSWNCVNSSNRSKRTTFWPLASG